jgi:hypothetical protein
MSFILQWAVAKIARRAAARGRPPAAPRPDDLPWWATARGAGALVAALAILAYARSLGNAFSYDEGLVIARAQPFLTSGSLGTLLSRRYFAASLEGTWRPFCTLTYMLDAALSMHPAMFKATNLAWHVGAAWLVMALARRLLPERHRRYAVVAGLLFALHPITTETVDNASFREDALVTVFTLATLVLALDGRPRLALASFALGLLSKESAVVAPALLALIRWGRVGPDARRPPAGNPQGVPDLPRWAAAAKPSTPGASLGALARELAPYGVVTALYLVVRFGPLKTPLAYARYPGGSFGAALAGLPAIWTHDFRLLFFPWPLCADLTGYFDFGAQPWIPFAGALAVVLLYGAAIWAAAARGQRLLALGLGWFIVALLPVSNLVPMPIPAAERFLYLPLAGIALGAAAGVGLLADAEGAAAGRVRRWLLGGAGLALLGAWMAIVNLRHGDWRDDERLWRATLAVNPRSCGAESAVGGGLLSRGMAETSPARARELLREAALRQQMALSLCAEETDVVRTAIMQTRLGAAEALLGERLAARTALERAAALAPRYALGVIWLGYLAHLDGDDDRAAALLRRAVVDLGPPDATVAAVAQLYVDKI